MGMYFRHPFTLLCEETLGEWPEDEVEERIRELINLVASMRVELAEAEVAYLQLNSPERKQRRAQVREILCGMS
jgi:hypothetical protein